MVRLVHVNLGYSLYATTQTKILPCINNVAPGESEYVPKKYVLFDCYCHEIKATLECFPQA